MTHNDAVAREAAPATPPTPTGPLDAAGRPRYRLGPLYLTYPLTSICLVLVWVGIGSYLIPIQVEQIRGFADPNALKDAVVVGAAVAAIGNPLFGYVSDRTRSRLGRRTPWLLICAILGAGALSWQANARSIGELALTWGCVQFILNGFQAAQTPTMRDRVPAPKYGLFSAVSGLATPVGSIITAVLISGIAGDKFGYHGVIGGFGGRFLGKDGYYLIAGLLVVFTLVFVFACPEAASKDMPLERFDARRFLSGFWVNPRKHPDFALAFVSRFGVVTGYFMVVTYSYYILMGYIKVAPADAASTLGLLLVVNSIAMVVATMTVGKLVDRTGRIKPFVLASGVLGALSLAIPMIFATVNGMIVFNIVNGAAFGVYMAVDIALITRVLPRGEDAGKDLGLINIANAAPQIAAPFVASAIVSAWGYDALFPLCACVALVGAVAVLKVESVS